MNDRRDNQRTPVVLFGGPADGYNGIDVHNLDETIEPSGHHARELGLTRRATYARVSKGCYHFTGYLDNV